jgi:hypothetical protein
LNAGTPLPAATTKRKPRDDNRLFDLSRLQKADFLPPLGNLIFTQIVQAVFAVGDPPSQKGGGCHESTRSTDGSGGDSL